MPDTVRTDVTGAPVTQLQCMLANKRLLSSHYRYGVFGNTAGYGTASRSAISRWLA